MALLFFTFGIRAYAILCFLAVYVRANDTSGILEVDLVFPRNETYAPTKLFPVVFAIQNSELASLVRPTLDVTIRDINNYSAPSISHKFYDMGWANYSSGNPYFEYHSFVNFNKDGHWTLRWNAAYPNCTGDRLYYRRASDLVTFTIEDGAKEVDLVTQTMEDTCDSRNGASLNITRTWPVPIGSDWDYNKVCPEIAPSAHKQDACQVEVSPETAASISSSIDLAYCKATSRPSKCGEEKDKNGSGHQLLVRRTFTIIGTLICLLI